MSQTKPAKKSDDAMQAAAKDSKPKQQPQVQEQCPSGSKASKASKADAPVVCPKSESRPNEPPTQHLHTKAAHGKEKHAFGGHSVPRGDTEGDPRALYPAPPYSEHTQQSPAIEGHMETLPDFGEWSYTGSGKLKDKVCLITGGDSGIGRAVALAFAREGASAVFIQHLEVENKDAKETERLVTAAKCGFASFAVDLDTEAACKKMVDACVGKFGRIDVLVLNSAVQGKAVKSILEMTAERVKKTFDVNILSMFNTVRLALPHMKPGAAIVTTASIQSYEPAHYIADYAATKAAIVNFTKGISRELIERGIRINAVAPGPIWTPLIVQSFPQEKVNLFATDKETGGPYGRPGQPAEVAPAFVFLACNGDSSFVTGEVIGVTGGRFLS
jgi:NAD(P)-dependent dehydrogenase (short-subunit alcohol dehydrogenase family)